MRQDTRAVLYWTFRVGLGRLIECRVTLEGTRTVVSSFTVVSSVSESDVCTKYQLSLSVMAGYIRVGGATNE